MPAVVVFARSPWRAISWWRNAADLRGSGSLQTRVRFGFATKESSGKRAAMHAEAEVGADAAADAVAEADAGAGA
jgi:hypothetical protein